ncbi:MAG TPA: UDP-N-acetylmuramoyl-L-alanine--D-glutamate ligase [Fimbriimonadaceae bacterium]|nr:UDP-N-acetylmuramoyl-L-alanine--D-glutamate ligase [Fimbriimonadaceae bacterium]
MNLAGSRIAVAGMGRSGQAIAKEAIARGAVVTVFDELPLESAASLEASERLQGFGVTVATGWHGHLDPTEFDLLVASPGFRRNHPAIRDMLGGGRHVISEVEFAFRIAAAPIVAITGTNGKSTTTVLTWLLLSGAGKHAVLCGNISGSGYPELTLTEAAASTETDGVLVAEVSSYQLEWVEDFKPKVAGITNITPDHLDRHPTFEDYYNTKLRLFAQMGDGDVAVLNESEPSLPADRLLGAIPEGVGIRTFASGPVMYGWDRGQFTQPSTRRDGDAIELSGRRVQLADLPLYGDHNVSNALMAWEMSVAMLGAEAGNAFEGMLGALAQFKGLAYRMERLGERYGVLVVNNSMCTNPMAVVTSSSSLDRPQHLLMGGDAKNLDFTPVWEYLQRIGHKLYLYGNAGDALVEQLGGLGALYPDLEAAFAAATAVAQSGDAILLAPGCASAFPYSNFRERGEAFRAMAERWLSS